MGGGGERGGGALAAEVHHIAMRYLAAMLCLITLCHPTKFEVRCRCFACASGVTVAAAGERERGRERGHAGEAGGRMDEGAVPQGSFACVPNCELHIQIYSSSIKSLVTLRLIPASPKNCP